MTDTSKAFSKILKCIMTLSCSKTYYYVHYSEYSLFILRTAHYEAVQKGRDSFSKMDG